ncbi:phytanoyl-CoA dioxygenase family protein [Cytophaga aurantiaca]|uniref:phytanoyl-CoA dioxygenase family protein n=1 Tax=Cytophaga aurantiaca TaxID=29530 RepID=UPI00036C45A2|nr:phytanoyl-CoA dioxygenase family protein [Cytophaga aurantiaca]
MVATKNFTTLIKEPVFTLGETLTVEQLNFFETHGYIHFKNFLKPEVVSTVIKALEDVQDQWIESNREKINGVPIKYGVDLDGKKIVQRFAFASLFSKVLNELLKDPRLKALYPLLQAKDERIGEFEKDGLVVNHYINSETSKFTQMGWHTDCLRDVFYGKKIAPMLNVGIHLDDYDPKNGGLRIIPGTHKQDIFDLLFKKKYYVSHKPDPDEIGFNITAGDLTVHDGRSWHRVEKSKILGEESRRRVMYIPFIGGEYQPKNENSSTQFYQRLSKFVR